MYKNILVPIDLGQIEQGKELIKTAMKIGQAEDVKLTLLHVLPPIPGYASAFIPEGQSQESQEKALQQLEEIASELGIADKAGKIVLIGSVHIEILTWAEEADVDLIVMASHQPEFTDHLIGTTAARVVRHAHCSVMVLRNL